MKLGLLIQNFPQNHAITSTNVHLRKQYKMGKLFMNSVLILDYTSGKTTILVNIWFLFVWQSLMNTATRFFLLYINQVLKYCGERVIQFKYTNMIVKIYKKLG